MGLPGALILVFAWQIGNFPGAASALGASMAHGTLLGLWVAAAFLPWRKPELAELAMLVGAVAVAWHFSPVARAGTTAVWLLPCFAILPRLTSALAGGGSRRREVAAGLVLALLVLGLRAWFGIVFEATPGASAPLGHHNLLAAILVLLLPWCWPLSLEGGWWRLGAITAAVVGGGALLATRSLAGILALASLTVLAAARHHRWLYGIFPLALGLQGPRLAEIFAGVDPSALARWAYLEAAWQGFLRHPWWGQGPGSTPWLLAETFQPIVGVHPPDHLVPDAHCLPLQLLFELGILGVASLVVALWGTGRRIFAADPAAGSAAWRDAGWVAVGAFVLMSFGGMPLAVTALPVTLACVVGLAHRPPTPAPASSFSRRLTVPLFIAWAVMALVWLLPRDLAMFHWQEAKTNPQAAEPLLAKASALDPDFPLYRLPATTELATPATAERARLAAEAARGVAWLWLEAGRLGVATGAPWSRQALERACELNRFGALAPWQLALAEPPLGTPEERVGWLARALVAEPRLIAARALAEPGVSVEAALDRLDFRVEIGWLGRLREVWRSRQDQPATRWAKLTLELDRVPAESATLHLFRREPSRRPLIRLEVDPERVPELQSALNGQWLEKARLEEAPAFFAAPLCPGPP